MFCAQAFREQLLCAGRVVRPFGPGTPFGREMEHRWFASRRSDDRTADERSEHPTPAPGAEIEALEENVIPFSLGIDRLYRSH